MQGFGRAPYVYMTVVRPLQQKFRNEHANEHASGSMRRRCRVSVGACMHLVPLVVMLVVAAGAAGSTSDGAATCQKCNSTPCSSRCMLQKGRRRRSLRRSRPSCRFSSASSQAHQPTPAQNPAPDAGTRRLLQVGVPDDISQMICRWINPESLRAYARHGQSLHINCVDQAEKAIIDTVQAANVPKTCATEGAVALHHTFGGRISARAQAVLDAADAAELDTGTATNVEVPDNSPLPPTQDCVGRRVLVARNLWPSYACDENDGRGWAAHIVRFHQGVATVRFDHAVDPRGLPYPDERLLLRALVPF